MSKLLFTEDDVNDNQSYEFFEEEDKLKAEGIKQFRFNKSALKWLNAIFCYGEDIPECTMGEVLSHPQTMIEALEWYLSLQNKPQITEGTWRVRYCLDIMYKVRDNRLNLRTVIREHSLYFVLRDVLICWNNVLPYKNEPDQQQTAAPAEEREPMKYTKKNTVKEVAFLFFYKYVGDDNSRFAVLRVGKGKGNCQEEYSELWELFIKEHPEIIQKRAITRDSFKTYLNAWRSEQVTIEK